MNIHEIIEFLRLNVNQMDMKLHEGATDELIKKAEYAYNVKFPEDIKLFYKFSNGFETDEDIFNFIRLEEIIENRNSSKEEPLYIAEYMIYSDMWALEIESINGTYQIFNNNRFGEKVILTNSLAEFIERFIKGGVFETGGLDEWGKEMRPQKK